MNDVTIRDLRPDDGEALAPLLEALGYPTSATQFRERLVHLRERDPGGRAIGAFDASGTALGFTYFMSSNWAPGTLLASSPMVRHPANLRRSPSASEYHFVNAT